MNSKGAVRTQMRRLREGLALKIGLAFDFRVVDRLPVEDGEERLHHETPEEVMEPWRSRE